MDSESPAQVETDPRFPSGAWTGFFLQRAIPGRHQMELQLTFRGGQMIGTGRDRFGEFRIDGRYQTSDGRCSWCKGYVSKHEVFYRGFNEGKGIWGTWEIRPPYAMDTGGFHIWPEGQSDPTQPRLEEEADLGLSADHLSGEVVEEVAAV